MKNLLFVFLMLLIGAVENTSGAVVILDAFEKYEISSQALNSIDQQVELPFSDRRSFGFMPGGVGSQWSTNKFIASDALGVLTYTVVGTSTVESFPLGMSLVYANSMQVQSLAGFSGIFLGFTGLTGVGTLYVELGSSLGIFDVQRVNLTGRGEVFYPISSIHANPGHTLEEFSVLKFTFEARTPEFSFTLDEIRLVPEPGSAACFLVAGAAGLSVRRRRAIPADNG